MTTWLKLSKKKIYIQKPSNVFIYNIRDLLKVGVSSGLAHLMRNIRRWTSRSRVSNRIIIPR